MIANSLSGQTPSPSSAKGTSVSATAPRGATPELAASAGKSSTVTAAEGRDTFLRLLVAQLEHQDPLKPMENADFTAQLAQFSTLEQIEKMNANLQAMADAQKALTGLQTKMQATNLVGKEVRIKGSTIQIQDKEATQLVYKLPAASPKVTVDIVDQFGSVVKSFDEGSQAAGEYKVPHNSTDNWVKHLPNGSYTVKVTATDGAGQPMTVDMMIQGRVNGVEYGDDQPFFLMGKNRVGFSDLVSIQEQAANRTSQR